jgi:hypothetical protein
VTSPTGAAEQQRRRESHSGHCRQHSITPSEPSAVTSGERKTVDSLSHVAILQERHWSVDLAELESRRQSVVQLKIQIGRSGRFECPGPPYTTDRRTGE